MNLRSNRYIENKIDDGKAYENKENAGLNIKNLSVEYKKRIVFKNVNMDFVPGKVYCITGQNGAGKSTLLRSICGLLKVSEGEILINGLKANKKDLIKKAFMVMQDVNYQLFSDSVLNECTLGVKGFNSEKVEDTLKEMGLIEYKDRHPNTLSGGQKQRLAIAVSLMMEKDILLFDEPTSGLDYGNMLLCAEFIKRLAKKGKIIIVVTHDEEFMECCCDKKYSLK